MSDINTSTSQSTLIGTVIDRIQSVIEQAEKEVRPLEMEPFRGNLFELFVMADGAGLLDDNAEPGLTSDAIAKVLADRWQLRISAQQSMQQQSPFSDESLSKMRLLWSFLRIWMEWTYAWQRWDEFHNGESARD